MHNVFVFKEEEEKIIEMHKLKKGQVGIIMPGQSNEGKVVMGLYHDGRRTDSTRPHSMALESGDTWSGDTNLKVRVLDKFSKIEIRLDGNQ